jgi:hypothetical protein
VNKLEMHLRRALYRLGAIVCKRVGHEMRFHLPRLWPPAPWWDFLYAYCPRCGRMLPSQNPPRA